MVIMLNKNETVSVRMELLPKPSKHMIRIGDFMRISAIKKDVNILPKELG